MWFVSPPRSLFSRHPWVIKIPQASTTAGSSRYLRRQQPRVAQDTKRRSKSCFCPQEYRRASSQIPNPLIPPPPSLSAPGVRAAAPGFPVCCERVCGSCVHASAGSCVCAGAARTLTHTHAGAWAPSRAPRRRRFTCVVGENPVLRFGGGLGPERWGFLKTYLITWPVPARGHAAPIETRES
jgi:hypothetical protein